MQNSFNVTPANEATQAHVKELNANVAVATFPNNTGEFYADLYRQDGSCPILVYSASCPPVCATFLKTVLIKL